MIAPPLPAEPPAASQAPHRNPPERLTVVLPAAAALVLLGIAFFASSSGVAEHNLRLHHLLHAALLCGGAIIGVQIGSWMRSHHGNQWIPVQRWSGLLLSVALLGPLLVMAVMIPATSDWIDAHPVAHALEHLGLICLGGLIGLNGRLFSAAFGWLAVVLLTAMALLFAGMVLP